MANVPTDEREVERPEPVNTATIRQALLDTIPDDHDIVRDIRIHDGIADISLRWKTLRWSTCMALQSMTPEEVAKKVDHEFRAWLRNIVFNMAEIPKFSRVVNEMRQWLRANPDKAAWLNKEAA